jgi:hypothetical protein
MKWLYEIDRVTQTCRLGCWTTYHVIFYLRFLKVLALQDEKCVNAIS